MSVSTPTNRGKTRKHTPPRVITGCGEGRKELTLPGFRAPEAVFFPTALFSAISFFLEATSACKSRKEPAPIPAAFALLVVDLGAIQAPPREKHVVRPIRKSRQSVSLECSRSRLVPMTDLGFFAAGLEIARRPQTVLWLSSPWVQSRTDESTMPVYKPCPLSLVLLSSALRA